MNAKTTADAISSRPRDGQTRGSRSGARAFSMGGGLIAAPRRGHRPLGSSPSPARILREEHGRRYTVRACTGGNPSGVKGMHREFQLVVFDQRLRSAASAADRRRAQLCSVVKSRGAWQMASHTRSEASRTSKTTC